MLKSGLSCAPFGRRSLTKFLSNSSASLHVASSAAYARLIEKPREQNRAKRSVRRPCSASLATMTTPQEGVETWDMIVTAYARAQDAGAAYQTNTLVQLYKDPNSGLEFVLRVAEALQDKPKLSRNSEQVKKAWVNPFLPYEEGLWVVHLSGSHTLLLNKFNIVAHHVLVVTRAFEPQSDPLNVRDFTATWAVVKAMPRGGLAYYNCGENSGASQPHKHVQVVPLPLADDLSDETTFAGLIRDAQREQGAADGQPFELRCLPFRSYAAVFQSGMSPDELAATYNALVVECFGKEALQHGFAPPGPSYNLIMTQSFMMVVPRSKEGAGPVSINAMGFAGSFFVRSKEELEYIMQEGPLKVLAGVGYPW